MLRLLAKQLLDSLDLLYAQSILQRVFWQMLPREGRIWLSESNGISRWDHLGRQNRCHHRL